MRASNWIQQADQAMIRAAARARALAASTNTSIHIMKDGRIVEIRHGEDEWQPVQEKLREDLELSIIREDPPPCDDKKS